MCHGLFTENAIIVAEGHYHKKVLHVTTLGFPPPEPRECTLCVTGTRRSKGWNGQRAAIGGTSNE